MKLLRPRSFIFIAVVIVFHLLSLLFVSSYWIDNTHQDKIIREAPFELEVAKSLLLLKTLPQSGENEFHPKETKYFSDQNRFFKKQQQAQTSYAIPHLRLSVPLPKRDIPAENRQDNSKEFEEKIAQEQVHQSILEKDFPMGTENLLNTRESIYYSFYSRMYGSVAPIWLSKSRNRISEVFMRNTLRRANYLAYTDIVLDENGNLVHVELIKSTGIKELDQIIFDAWNEVKKLPNPPRSLLDQQRHVHIHWTYRYDFSGHSHSAIQFLAPRNTSQSSLPQLPPPAWLQ